MAHSTGRRRPARPCHNRAGAHHSRKSERACFYGARRSRSPVGCSSGRPASGAPPDAWSWRHRRSCHIRVRSACRGCHSGSGMRLPDGGDGPFPGTSQRGSRTSKEPGIDCDSRRVVQSSRDGFFAVCLGCFQGPGSGSSSTSRSGARVWKCRCARWLYLLDCGR